MPGKAADDLTANFMKRLTPGIRLTGNETMVSSFTDTMSVYTLTECSMPLEDDCPRDHASPASERCASSASWPDPK